VTQDRNSENAEVVPFQRFLGKKYFYQIDSLVQSLQHNFVLKNHQELLVGKKLCEDSEYGKASANLYSLNESGKCTNQNILLSTHEIINAGEKVYECKESGDYFTFGSHLFQVLRRGECLQV
jgi:hypothetical protein